MKDKIRISGFADEIDVSFRTQLETVTSLGMHYISLRSADGKNIADFTAGEAKEQLLPVLQEFGVGVSSLGSPIGKVGLRDEAGFHRQLQQLEELCGICRVLDCRYIRIFSFFIPEGENPDRCRDEVLAKMALFVGIAEKNGIILLHENEKDIYGDIGRRNKDLLETIDSPHLRAAFDFANYVQCGDDPEVCWNLVQPYIEYIHIKDAVTADKENVVCGTGEGKIELLLRRAINEEGYEGFLTLEPHLVLFASLGSLEKAGADQIIKKNKAANGAEGYAMQYRALCEILERI